MPLGPTLCLTDSAWLSVVPLAMVSQLWSYGVAPRYLWLAQLGNTLAHELMHSFDINGWHFDERGEVTSWLTPDTRLRLTARIQCLVNQYAATFSHSVRLFGRSHSVDVSVQRPRESNQASIVTGSDSRGVILEVTEIFLFYEQFDWNVTSNENLADIGALQVSYDAWLNLNKVHSDLRLPMVDLSPHQLFFVAVAQVSCNSQYLPFNSDC